MAIGPDTPRARAAAASRTKVLAAAAALFGRHGYDAVTMRQIAGEIGMSTGVLFSHFAGKAELFEAATGHPAPDVAAFLLKVIQARSECADDDDRRAALIALGEQAELLRHHLLGHHA